MTRLMRNRLPPSNGRRPTHNFPPLLLAICLAAGCGPVVDPDRPATVPVTVNVKHQQQPVEGAVVTFVHDEAVYSASGMTDRGGIARMWTFAENDGVVPGNYRVTILKAIVPEFTEEDDPSPLSGEPMKHLIPERYSRVDGSGLTARIEAGRPVDLVFELENSQN